MSLVEQGKIPTTIPNLTGKYDSFKWAAHFGKMEVRVPQSFLEIGTAEKGLRFDRAKWDRFQEAIVASVKGLPEHLMVLGYFDRGSCYHRRGNDCELVNWQYHLQAESK